MRVSWIVLLLAASMHFSSGHAAYICPGKTTADDVLAGIDLTGKVAVVTGGDSGLGYAISAALARHGAAVVIGNRNSSHGEQAARKIAAETGAEVHAGHLDLGSFASVRAFAAAVHRYSTKLHILVNNAGIEGPSTMTRDGYELVFEVDYLGHFLLTELLLPALRSQKPAFIVNVASGAHENACEQAGWPTDCFKDWSYLPPPVVPVKEVTVHTRKGTMVMNSTSYGIAKFANVQHAAALAEREAHAGVEAFSLTPGFVLTGMTGGFDPSSQRVKAICEAQEHPESPIPANPCPFSPEQGAAVIASCASGQARSGEYYSRTLACQSTAITMHGFTADMQREFYERSLEWVQLEAPPPDTHYV